MQVQITAQGCELANAIRQRAEATAAHWRRFDLAATNASFVFRIEGRTHSAEAVVHRRRLEPVVAHAEASNFRSALDELDERMKRILKKDRERRKTYRPTPGAGQ